MEEKTRIGEKKGLECFIREEKINVDDVLYVISITEYIHNMFKEVQE